jgi:acetyl esterase/lipase
MPRPACPSLAARLLCALLAAASLAGCSASGIVAALTPDEGYRVERDIPYGADPRQRLDLYTPDPVRPDAPLVVFFYGGRWQSGSKDLYAFVGQAFASRGYVVGIPDYRLFPQVRWRGFLEDGAAAVARAAERVADQAAGPRGDGPRRVALAGHSAGAYIAAMLALDGRRLAAAGLDPCLVAAGIGLAGPYDFLPLDDADLREIFGPGEAGPDTQPISHADPGDPPMLLLTGAEDGTVRPGNADRLAARLRAAGARAEARAYDGIGHLGILASLAAPFRFLAPALDDADAFLRSAGTGGRCEPPGEALRRG